MDFFVEIPRKFKREFTIPSIEKFLYYLCLIIRMKEKDVSDDDELDKELEKNFKENDRKRNVFKVLRDEKSSREVKEKRIKQFKL